MRKLTPLGLLLITISLAMMQFGIAGIVNEMKIGGVSMSLAGLMLLVLTIAKMPKYGEEKTSAKNRKENNDK